MSYMCQNGTVYPRDAKIEAARKSIRQMYLSTKFWEVSRRVMISRCTMFEPFGLRGPEPSESLKIEGYNPRRRRRTRLQNRFLPELFSDFLRVSLGHGDQI